MVRKPRNESKNGIIGTVFKTSVIILSTVTKTLFSLANCAIGTVSFNSTTNSTAVALEVMEDENVSTCESNECLANSTIPDSAESVESSFMSMLQPKHYSFRTIQLANVEFPIDHAAILWCHQLLQVVTKGMKVLSSSPAKSDVDINKVIPILSNKGDQYSNLTNEAYLKTEWTRASLLEEHYILQNLSNNSFLLLAFQFVTHHGVKVITCYVVTSLLEIGRLTIDQLRNNVVDRNEWEMLLPSVHLCTDLWMLSVLNIASQIRSAKAPVTWSSFAIPIVIIFFLLYLLARKFLTGEDFFTVGRPYVFWIVAYFLALLVKSLFLLVVSAVQYLFSGVAGMLEYIWRTLVFRKTMRRAWKQTKKSVIASIPEILVNTITYSIPALMFLSASIAIYILRLKHFSLLPTLSTTTVATAISFLVLFASFVILLMYGLICKIKNYSTFVMLYTPLIMSMAPSIQYAVGLIFAPARHLLLVSPMLSNFNQSLVLNSLVIVVAIAQIAGLIYG